MGQKATSTSPALCLLFSTFRIRSQALGVLDTVLSCSASQGHASYMTETSKSQGLSTRAVYSLPTENPTVDSGWEGALLHSHSGVLAGGGSALVHTGLPAAWLVQAQKWGTPSMSP